MRVEWVCETLYLPSLRFSFALSDNPDRGRHRHVGRHRHGVLRGGIVPSILFPKSDNNYLQATIAFPDGTPAAETDQATRRMEERSASHDQVAKERDDREEDSRRSIYPAERDLTGPVRLTYRDVGTITNPQNSAGGGGSGSHVGQIFVELHDTEIREIHSDELLAMWREEPARSPASSE